MRMKFMKVLDSGSVTIMAITLVLFVMAVFTTGFTHDILLETGVFLVSIKLMIMTYKNGVSAETTQRQLQEIKELLLKNNPPR